METMKRADKIRLQRGLYSLLLCVVMALVVLGVNLLFSLLPQRMTKIDLTAQGLYTLSPETEALLNALQEDIDMYLIVEPGKEDMYTQRLLESYADHAEKIRVRQINPLTNPLFTAAYTEETVENNSVIVASATRSKVVKSADMYSYGFDYVYYTYATVFNGEARLTNALRFVTDPDVPIVYALTGHGEAAIADNLRDSVTSDNMELRELDLLSAGRIPDDAQAVLLFSPATDITAEESKILTRFLDEGGGLVLVAGYTGQARPHLDSLMAGCGMAPSEGVVIEGDDAYSLSGYAYYLLPKMEEEDINTPLLESGQRVLVPAAMGITENEHRSSLSVRPLYTTSAAAYLKKNPEETTSYEKEAGDVDGPFHVAMLAEEEIGAQKKARVVWFASDMMFTDTAEELSSGTNTNSFVNALSFVMNRGEGIRFREKSTIMPTLTVTTGFRNAMLIVTAVLLPLAALLAGVFIMAHRRRGR